MSRFIINRGLIFFGLWLLALAAPWWLLLPALILAIWRQPHFYELLLLGWWYDSAYGPGGTLLAPYWPLLVTLIIFLLIWLIDLAKESLVIYRRAF